MVYTLSSFSIMIMMLVEFVFSIHKKHREKKRKTIKKNFQETSFLPLKITLSMFIYSCTISTISHYHYPSLSLFFSFFVLVRIYIVCFEFSNLIMIFFFFFFFHCYVIIFRFLCHCIVPLCQFCFSLKKTFSHLYRFTIQINDGVIMKSKSNFN